MRSGGLAALRAAHERAAAAGPARRRYPRGGRSPAALRPGARREELRRCPGAGLIRCASSSGRRLLRARGGHRRAHRRAARRRGHHGDAGCTFGLLLRGGPAHAGGPPRLRHVHAPAGRRLRPPEHLLHPLRARGATTRPAGRPRAAASPWPRFERLLEEADAEAMPPAPGRCTPQAQAVLLDEQAVIAPLYHPDRYFRSRA